MAASEEELERLKQKRSAAQTAFTRRANYLTSRASALGESEMRSEWRNFKVDHSRVRDAGFEYATALREVDDDEAKKKAENIDGKTAECDCKFDETEQIILISFWTRFAEAEITTLTEEAGSAMDQAEDTDHHHMTRRECELIHRNLEREVNNFERGLDEWKDLIPRSKATESKDQIRKLKKRREKLWDEWAWIGGSQSDDEGKLGKVKFVEQEEPVGTYNYRPQISLERARLPMFAGNMRDYYRWKAEWEDLQRLGNPHGLENVRKFHLLGSLDEKVKRDLVLSSCGSANDVFRLLDNKYGNKPKIVLLIAQEVQGLCPIKGNHPRKTIELIQAVERALRDLQVLGEEDAVKNRVVVQSIESKLPDSLKEKWLTHKNDPGSGFSPRNHFDCLLQYLMKQ